MLNPLLIYDADGHNTSYNKKPMELGLGLFKILLRRLRRSQTILTVIKTKMRHQMLLPVIFTIITKGPKQKKIYLMVKFQKKLTPKIIILTRFRILIIISALNSIILPRTWPYSMQISIFASFTPF